MKPSEDEVYERAGPLPTVAAFVAGVVTLIWGVWEVNWLLVALAIFVLVISTQYYIRVARHLPWRPDAASRESGHSNHKS